MQRIDEYLSYEKGGHIAPHVLYMDKSAPMYVRGKVDFTAFGTIKMNGVKIINQRMHVSLTKVTCFEVSKDSAIMFNKSPMVARDIPENIPVEPVPDIQDAYEKQMHMLFNQWAKSRGMIAEDKFIDDDEIDEDYFDEYDQYDMDSELDPSNIVPFMAEEDQDKEPSSMLNGEATENYGTPEVDAGGTTDSGDEDLKMDDNETQKQG